MGLLLSALVRAQSPTAVVAAPGSEPGRFEAMKDSLPLPNSPFVRYFTADELGRRIVFYVAEPAAGDATTKLPVIVNVQGSGSQSVFTRVERDGVERAGASGGQGTVRLLAKDRAIVVIAEKPGVKFLDRPSQPGSRPEDPRTHRRPQQTPERVSTPHHNTRARPGRAGSAA